MVRSLEDLRRDQQAILDAYRAERPLSPPVASSSEASLTGHAFLYGRVVEVVTSHPVHGPHLWVMRQSWSPQFRCLVDAGGAPLRCYPAPPRSVISFMPDDTVRISIVEGAFLVEALP
ncbi:MAG TPA: hypothetical protein PL151_07750 [Phycisphaerae bacterium]|nr:hypothetical protein [Phycisphaerae bacterium]HOJ75286.1 hypothetical protein [Phycisphaerae bacterium]HOM53049.1 hypothetical protein [Phycisphaerae bacterium]HON66986.1 hypothetical protein [Phycisphaerae bacterium]HOQ88209.1 hypothetical protein [Phycisphaerae bacterium]